MIILSPWGLKIRTCFLGQTWHFVTHLTRWPSSVIKLSFASCVGTKSMQWFEEFAGGCCCCMGRWNTWLVLLLLGELLEFSDCLPVSITQLRKLETLGYQFLQWVSSSLQGFSNSRLWSLVLDYFPWPCLVTSRSCSPACTWGVLFYYQI